jgi:DNA-directed RNA polymerase subunit RPC12/RpoP
MIYHLLQFPKTGIENIDIQSYIRTQVPLETYTMPPDNTPDDFKFPRTLNIMGHYYFVIASHERDNGIAYKFVIESDYPLKSEENFETEDEDYAKCPVCGKEFITLSAYEFTCDYCRAILHYRIRVKTISTVDVISIPEIIEV